jgi:hypothetical protein
VSRPEESAIVAKPMKTAEGRWDLRMAKEERGKTIGSWVATQKYNERNGKLSAIRKERFDDLGIEWLDKKK